MGLQHLKPNPCGRWQVVTDKKHGEGAQHLLQLPMEPQHGAVVLQLLEFLRQTLEEI